MATQLTVGKSGNGNESTKRVRQKGTCPTGGDRGLWTGEFLGQPTRRVSCPECGH